MHRFFYKIIKNNFTINSFCVVLLLLYCANCIASKPVRIYNMQRDPAYDAATAINEYKRFYWHYPDSKELFIIFTDSYAAYFWSGLTNKDKTNATWYQFYKKIKSNRNDYLISTLDKYCIYTDFKERRNMVLVDDLCEDCKLEKMSMADFKRRYSLCAFDCDGNILWDNSELLNQLYIQIQQQINIVQATDGALEYNRAEMILFKYRHNDGTITFICDLDSNDSAIFEIVKEDIYQLLNDFCNRYTDISEINMFAYLSKRIAIE